MQQLSGQDAMFLSAELDGLPQHVGGVSIYDQSSAPNGVVRFKEILAHLQSRVHLSPIFTHKLLEVPLGLDTPYWVEDPDFDIEYHVRHIALPKPGNWRQLCILVSRLHSRPLSRDKPLWEMYVIEGLDNVEGLPKGSFALLQKVHHAAMDGPKGVEFMTAIHDITNIPDDRGSAPPREFDEPSKANLLGKAYINALKRPGRFYDFVKEAAPAYMRIREGKKRQDFAALDDKQTTRFQGKISPHRVVDACKFDFEAVRAIKNTLPGTTINDVMLTIVAGGLRKYLESKDELPDKTLVSGCPIDVRTESEKDEGGNHVGLMNVALRTDIEDPYERLKAVHKEAKSAKAYAQALGPRIMMDITDMLPSGVLSVAMKAAAATGLSERQVVHNTIVTNVPGAPMQLYFAGAALVDSLSFGPLMPNMGLFHIVLSMVQNKKGTLTVSFTACREMLPDPAFYTECLKASFDDLQVATDKAVKEEKEKAKAGNTEAKTKAQEKTAAKPKAKAKAKAKSA
ncbi:MAG: wax ester/triacylglycerol synthase family O-acyltransferase [Pseudomonadales bacterium]|nr:wax ester/triacylglycerol synthase family O-acyltransferase [Pseudomonadales bacterium]